MIVERTWSARTAAFQRGFRGWCGGGLLAAGLLLAPLVAAQHVSDEDHVFRSGVHDAIERGVTWLYGELRDHPSDRGMGAEYPLGMRALMVYALLEAEVPADAPVVRQLLSEMERLPLRRVYGVSLLVLALDALTRRAAVATDTDKTSRREGAPDHVAVRKALRAAAEWLIQARQRGEGMWGYEPVKTRGRGPATWVDFSNLQFAVLALHAAQRHDLAIPPEVWIEVVGALHDAAMARGGPAVLSCQGLGWWPREGVVPGSDTAPDGVAVTLSAHGFELHGVPRGWPYRPTWNLPPWAEQHPSLSMTAAAVSSLMIARSGLAGGGLAGGGLAGGRGARQLSGELRARIDGLVAGGLMSMERQFGALFPSPGDSLWRNYFYTLYSIEKAMDLGGVVLLGAHDWYRAQARVLIAAQRPDGAWGSAHGVGEADAAHDQERVNTAFALLFLKRATRALRVDPAMPIETLAGDAPDRSGVTAGTVFVASQKGMVRLRDLFDRLAAERTRELLAVAEEIARSVSPHEEHELLPYVMRLRDGSFDRVEEFARRLIRDLAGCPGEVPEPQLLAWIDRVRDLERWAATRAVQHLSAIEALLTGDNEPLRRRAFLALERIASLDSVPALISTLARGGPVAERADAALKVITQQDPGGAVGPDRGAQWQRFWDQHGARLRADREWDRLRQGLEIAGAPAERARLRGAIVALGVAVLPKVQEILAGDSFAFDWVLVAEALTGQRPGL